MHIVETCPSCGQAGIVVPTAEGLLHVCCSTQPEQDRQCGARASAAEVMAFLLNRGKGALDPGLMRDHEQAA